MDLTEVFATIFGFIVLFGPIFLIYYLGNKNYKKSDYYNETGIPFLTLRFNKGLYGEYLTRKNLEQIDGHKRFLSNCYLTKQNGETTEVDLIMIHTSGIYVFESKNYGGWIFGEENSKQWMQTFKTGEKNRFFNPIMQNRGHISALKKVLAMDDDSKFQSVIVFSDRCTFKKVNVTTPVIHRRDIGRAVQELSRRNPYCLTEPQIDDFYQKLLPLTQVSDQVKQKHIQDIKAKYQ